MKPHMLLAATLGLAGCTSGYASASFGSAEPVEQVYVVPVERVVVVTREVLVDRGWTVYRVERSGPNRIVWARRRDNEVVRIVAAAQGERVALRGLREERERDDRGRHRGWKKRGPPRDIIADIDIRLRTR